MIRLIYSFLSLLDSRGRRQAFLLLGAMLAVAILEMANVGMVVPLLQAIIGQAESPALVRLQAFLPTESPKHTVILIAALFAGLTIFKNAAVLGVIYMVNRFIAMKSAQFQQRIYHIYLAQPSQFHVKRNSAQTLRNLTSSVFTCFEGIRIILTAILDLVLILGACVLLLLVEPMATLISAAALISLAIVYHQIAAPRLRHWGHRSHEIEADLLKQARQALENIKLIKLTNTAEFFEKSFHVLTHTRARILSYTLTSLNVPRTIIETILIVGFLVCLIALLSANYQLVELFPVVGLFGMVALRLMPSMNRLMSGLADIRHRTAPIEELIREIHLSVPGSESRIERMPFNSSIEISGVIVSYDDKRDDALKNINLIIRRGERIGLVGPSGSGKSTLADTIMGLIEPAVGNVRVDGVNINEHQTAWRSCIGYVPQDIFLLDDTIRRNIAFGIPNESVDESRLVQAIKLSCLDSVISKLPDGVDTVIGEHGRRLSGGQRQRIGIARALYRDPDVIIFDEATSSLDNESESAVIEATQMIAATKTIIIIAHRLSSIRPCNRLIFLTDGQVCGEGTLEQLVSANPSFARMASLGEFRSPEPA